MTTLEFAKKCLAKARMNLERVQNRPVAARAEDLKALTEKVEHYEEIVRILEEKAEIKKKSEEKPDETHFYFS